jgi:predicted phosphodiesterase
MLTWLHVGDLHISHEDGSIGIDRLRALVQEANRYLPDGVDFVFLPGDNANNGTPEQYGRIGEVLNELALPLHAVPGDHDFEPGNLDAYHAMPGAEVLPGQVDVDGRRCLFLDIVSAGSGGPDFRLGKEQLRWLERELAKPAAADRRPVVFMHAYPGDMHQEGEHLGQLFASARVAVVDTGHTHYNELLNDGTVIYASTRSTGQVQEGGGAAGFSLVAVDGTTVSWRFKSLGSSWPFVLITSPADHRLTTASAAHEQVSLESLVVRAKVFGDNIASVTVSVDHGEPLPMHAVVGEPAVWTGTVALPNPAESYGVVVRAQDADGSCDEDRIEALLANAISPEVRRLDAVPGTDAWAVPPWPEHGVLGSQLGPNKNGQKW